MRRLHCEHCQALVVLENDRCLQCGSRLAYVPELREMVAWGAAGAEAEETRALGPMQHLYRLCGNYLQHAVCNWAVAVADASDLCRSCRLTRVIPDLAVADNVGRWYRMEAAKRRLIVGLIGLSLPLDHADQAQALPLLFEFKADEVTPSEIKPVLTGHDGGVISVNIAEADDDERERRRVALHEPYRTLLGHFRHEVGHYYWDRLIQPSRRLASFRKLFGDERIDYGAALQLHYRNGPPADWQDRYISAYAACHPWEDWAETWAHYLHMLDTLEIAHEAGLSLKPRRHVDPGLTLSAGLRAGASRAFGGMLERWRALSYVLNELNRGLGLRDAYPFVISPAVITKLDFVHRTIELRRAAAAA